MASTFTTNFAIEKPGTGEQSGTWGTTTNHNFDIFDRLAGYKSVTLSNTSSTLTIRPSSPSSGSSNTEDGMFRAIKFADGGDIGGAVALAMSPNTAACFSFFKMPYLAVETLQLRKVLALMSRLQTVKHKFCIATEPVQVQR